MLFKQARYYLKKIEYKENIGYMQSYVFIKNRFCKRQNMVFTFEYPYRLKGLIRYKSTVALLSNSYNTYRTTNLVNEHIKKR